jgi:hypothetical protein
MLDSMLMIEAKKASEIAYHRFGCNLLSTSVNDIRIALMYIAPIIGANSTPEREIDRFMT